MIEEEEGQKNKMTKRLGMYEYKIIPTLPFTILIEINKSGDRNLREFGRDGWLLVGKKNHREKLSPDFYSENNRVRKKLFPDFTLTAS